MIYQCKICNRATFKTNCANCGDVEKNILAPLDASFYPDFHYESKGFVKDLFGKKKEKAQLQELLENVLTKYSEFLDPYFINFVHIILEENEVQNNAEGHTYAQEKSYTQKELFQEVLLQKGFTELSDLPDLLDKLLLTTIFASSYTGFKKELARHVQKSLTATLRSWIEETGKNFRNDICLFLYFLWEADIKFDNLKFNPEASTNREMTLYTDQFIDFWLQKAEQIYRDILVKRLESKLANFDPTNYATIYLVDAMDGFEFEDFLVVLFQTIGYDVKETKKTGDQGADLFVERFGKKTVIQAKNYTGNVGNSAVQQALSAKTFYSCDEAMVVSNSYFTKSAKELASSASVRLIDRDKLINYLDDYNQQLIDQVEMKD